MTDEWYRAAREYHKADRSMRTMVEAGFPDKYLETLAVRLITAAVKLGEVERSQIQR